METCLFDYLVEVCDKNDEIITLYSFLNVETEKHQNILTIYLSKLSDKYSKDN